MSDKKNIAVERFLKGYNCAQSVVYAFADEIQIDKENLLKIACGFGAGIARKQEICGALSGGIMVIGMKYGRGENDDRQNTEITYQKVRELMDQFSKINGSYSCRKLLNGCDLTTEKGQKEFKENDYLHKICKPCVESVVLFLEERLI